MVRRNGGWNLINFTSRVSIGSLVPLYRVEAWVNVYDEYYPWDFSQSEMEKYFEWIIKHLLGQGRNLIVPNKYLQNKDFFFQSLRIHLESQIQAS